MDVHFVRNNHTESEKRLQGPIGGLYGVYDWTSRVESKVLFFLSFFYLRLMLDHRLCDWRLLPGTVPPAGWNKHTPRFLPLQPGLQEEARLNNALQLCQESLPIRMNAFVWSYLIVTNCCSTSPAWMLLCLLSPLRKHFVFQFLS